MKSYDTYDAVALAQDQSFIRWVRDKDEEAVFFWEQWQMDHPEKAATIEEARQIVLSLRQFREPVFSKKDRGDLWQSINQGIEEKGPAKIIKLPVRRLSVAAAFLLILTAAYFLWTNYSATRIKTDPGEWLTHELPDDTQVELNASSRLMYREKSWQKERMVRLKGEALFEVTEGTPFLVQTDNGQVEVLGTRFNVFDREGQFKVDCYSGRVRVTYKEKSVILTAGKSALVRNAVLDTLSFDAEEKQLWLDGFFDFENATLREVFEEMERQFDIRIKSSEEIKALPYDGFFEKSNLDSAFYTVCFPLGCEVEKVSEDVYHVRKRE